MVWLLGIITVGIIVEILAQPFYRLVERNIKVVACGIFIGLPILCFGLYATAYIYQQFNF